MTGATRPSRGERERGEADLAAAAGTAMAGLPRMSPHRLRALLAVPALDAWSGVRAGAGFVERVLGGREDTDLATLARTWASAARLVDLDTIRAANEAAGVAVHLLGDRAYPASLASDPEAPAVLFTVGDLKALEGPRVGIVGTRSATYYGQDVAAELGRDLSGAGVSVVSGLAVGIDGAAHEGALAAEPGRAGPPVGVVASGLDVVYPRRHVRLWNRVATNGVLLSEAPLGAPAQAWRFPPRNRIMAAMAQVVVVVECHRGGGSLHTVEAAARRGTPVMAVPGSVRSPASEGTNALLADGCPPARDADDVLAALDLERTGPARRERACRQMELEAAEGAVLSALEWRPIGIEEVMRRTGMALEEVAPVLDRLDVAGLARRGDCWWART